MPIDVEVDSINAVETPIDVVGQVDSAVGTPIDVVVHNDGVGDNDEVGKSGILNIFRFGIFSITRVRSKTQKLS